MKTMKKILSVFLVSILGFSTIGMSAASAESASFQFNYPEFIEEEASIVETEDSSLLIESQGIPEEYSEDEDQERILPALLIRLAISTGAKYTIKYVAKASQLQSKYKHAVDFGVDGNYNVINRTLFENALKNHVEDATEIYLSTYRGSDVFVFMKDGRFVYTDLDGEFISGWKYTEEQGKFHREKGKRATKQ